MKAPIVDNFAHDHLQSHFPTASDNQLRTIQATLLQAADPLMSLWADLVANDTLSEGSTISIQDSLYVVQCTLVLTGNTNVLRTESGQIAR